MLFYIPSLCSRDQHESMGCTLLAAVIPVGAFGLYVQREAATAIHANVTSGAHHVGANLVFALIWIRRILAGDHKDHPYGCLKRLVFGLGPSVTEQGLYEVFLDTDQTDEQDMAWLWLDRLHFK